MTLSAEATARFWSYVDRSAGPDACWPWQRGLWRGYGAACVGNKTRRAHRVAYELVVGPIPEGLTLDHLCRNRACVNPAHLEPVTNRENVLRGNSPIAMHARKTACLRGHEFTPENTLVLPQGGRVCRACQRSRQHGDDYLEKRRERDRRYRQERRTRLSVAPPPCPDPRGGAQLTLAGVAG